MPITNILSKQFNSYQPIVIKFKAREITAAKQHAQNLALLNNDVDPTLATSARNYLLTLQKNHLPLLPLIFHPGSISFFKEAMFCLRIELS